jgi:hypothetical protein
MSHKSLGSVGEALEGAVAERAAAEKAAAEKQAAEAAAASARFEQAEAARLAAAQAAAAVRRERRKALLANIGGRARALAGLVVRRPGRAAAVVAVALVIALAARHHVLALSAEAAKVDAVKAALDIVATEAAAFRAAAERMAAGDEAYSLVPENEAARRVMAEVADKGRIVKAGDAAYTVRPVRVRR